MIILSYDRMILYEDFILEKLSKRFIYDIIQNTIAIKAVIFACALSIP